jgi:hypothetical protein
MVKQVDPLWCSLRNTAISQTGLEGKSKLPKSGYDEGGSLSELECSTTSRRAADNVATLLIVAVATTPID